MTKPIGILFGMAACLAACGTMTPGQAAAQTPTAEPAEPQRDYVALLPRFDQIIGSLIFNPAVLEQPEWHAFREEFGALTAQAQSDVEFRQAFETARDNHVLFSHFELMLLNESLAQRLEAADAQAQEEAVATFTDRGNGIGLIHIRSFFGAAIMEQINARFGEAIAADLDTLIIDLRGNLGGTFAAWPVLARLAPERMPVGYLVANRWFSAHDAVPSEADVAAATPMTQPDAQALGRDLMDDGLLVMAADPQTPTFDGDVLILVDRVTGSTSEVVTGALQYNGRARIVGPGSAGEVLNADQAPLDEGIALLIPLADFFLHDGSRLEGSGITPDYPASAARALDCALALAAGSAQSLAQSGNYKQICGADAP